MKPICVVPLLLLAAVFVRADDTQAASSSAPALTSDKSQDVQKSPPSTQSNQQPPVNVGTSSGSQALEGRISDGGFIRDIVERLHALDADIGKLLYNSTSMYAPDDQTAVFRENQPKGGERFTEVLADLDALQDEVSVVS